MTRQLSLTVRYAETDAQGVVHHANYLTWFEEGRSDFLRQQGIHYRDWERAGYFVVVAAAEVDYRAPAFYEDDITIETTLVRLRRRLIEFTYRAVNSSGQLIAEGRTRHLVLDRDRKPTRLPEELIARIRGREVAA